MRLPLGRSKPLGAQTAFRLNRHPLRLPKLHSPPLANSRREQSMQVEGFFDWLGHALGTVIRFIVDSLSGLLQLIGNAGRQFLHGLSGALGITPSLLSIVALVIGLLFLYSAVRAFMRRSVVLGIIWLLLGLWLISLLIS